MGKGGVRLEHGDLPALGLQGLPPTPSPPSNLDPIQLSLRQVRPLRGPKEPLICAGLAGPLSPWDSVFAKNHKELSIELALDVGWAGEKAGEGEEGGLHLRPRQGCVEGVAFSLFLRHV